MDKLELIEKAPLTSREKEVYRTLRTNEEFTGIENRLIAVTSCAPDDGKTTVSFNLANAFAENGKKTLYIDADLRKSVFIQRYNVDGNPKGLSHYLSGQASLKDIIYRTNKERLYVVPVGTFPSNPTELFNKDRFGQLLDELKKVFDYIIVDTPPLGSVIDAAIIANKCDASILALSSDKCSRGFVKGVIAQLRSANPNFLGVVLNKVDMKNNSYYGKKYGGYYGKKYGSYASYYGNEE